MIRRIAVSNFQSIEAQAVTLSRVTAFVGPSNSGKTALMRAIYAAATNARGTDYIRNGASTTKIEFDVDGKLLFWTKGAKAVYLVGNEQFTNIGNTVPEPVEFILRLSQHLEDQPLNFGFQFEPLFFVSVSAPARARIIGEISGALILQDASKRARDEQRRLSRDVNLWQEELQQYETLDANLATYALVASMMVALENLQAELLLEQDKLTLLISTKAELDRLTTDTDLVLTDLADVLLAEAAYVELLDGSDELTELHELKAQATQLILVYRTDTSVIDAAINVIEELEQLNFQLDAMRELEANLKQIKAAVSAIITIDAEIEDWESKLSVSDICPTCGRPYE